MGTSKRAALSIAKQLPTAGALAVGPWTLDDFLERGAPWTSLTVIITSSFGRGDAPRNATRFRLLCDSWLDTYDGTTSSSPTGNADATPPSPPRRPLTGLRLALCGLGDSAYSTFQENPLALVAGLTAAGATLVGPVGVADKSSDQQQAHIDAWIEGLWAPLATAAAAATGDGEWTAASKSTLAAVADLPLL
jgi:sulfite reductase alpha subunit-like flavoprotein